MKSMRTIGVLLLAMGCATPKAVPPAEETGVFPPLRWQEIKMFKTTSPKCPFREMLPVRSEDPGWQGLKEMRLQAQALKAHALFDISQGPGGSRSVAIVFSDPKCMR